MVNELFVVDNLLQVREEGAAPPAGLLSQPQTHSSFHHLRGIFGVVVGEGGTSDVFVLKEGGGLAT